MATILKVSKISPSSSADEFSLPITFFDMLWYDLSESQSVLFFDYPNCSKSHFLNAIVPDLETSLSVTLSHFLPLSGHIIHPLTPGKKPFLRYQNGDSVYFTVSESLQNYNYLKTNNSRICDEFYALAPQLPKPIHSEYSIAYPVLALQVTFFPGHGLCIGFASNHAVADASTVASFMHAWSLTNKNRSVQNRCLPFYDRETLINLNGLDSVYWDLISSQKSQVHATSQTNNKLRATFVLKKDEIQKLKSFVIAKSPNVAYLSSFTVICALIWFCTAKSAGDEVADDELEYFRFAADCRMRLNPPLPVNYFGNCVTIVNVELKHGEVKGRDGLVKAAKAIGEATKQKVYNENGILYGAENWVKDCRKLTGKRQYGVWGSPKFDFYGVDFGWGKACKFEVLSIDNGGAVSLCKSREFEGGIEIGLSNPKIQMIISIFNEVLTNLLQ